MPHPVELKKDATPSSESRVRSTHHTPKDPSPKPPPISPNDSPNDDTDDPKPPPPKPKESSFIPARLPYF